MFVKVKGSVDVAVAAEAPMYDVEWSESNAEGDGPQQSEAATLFVTDDASTATATGALMNCTSILAKNWSSVEAVVNAASSSNVKHVVFVAGSLEECGKIRPDSILYGILENVQQFWLTVATRLLLRDKLRCGDLEK